MYVRMCMYICMHAHTYVRTYVCMYVSTLVCSKYLRTYVHVRKYVGMVGIFHVYVHAYMSVWCVGYAAVNAAHLHKVLVDFSTLVTCTFLMPPRPYTHSVCWLQGVDPQERHLSTGPEPALAHVVPQMLPLQQARHRRVCGSVSKLAPLTAEPNGFALSLSVSLLCLWSFTVDHWFSAVHMCTCESLMWYVHTYGGSVVYWCKVGSTACTYIRTYLLSTYVVMYCTYVHMYIHMYFCVL